VLLRERFAEIGAGIPPGPPVALAGKARHVRPHDVLCAVVRYGIDNDPGPTQGPTGSRRRWITCGAFVIIMFGRRRDALASGLIGRVEMGRSDAFRSV
jgi:hypothetical protein